MAEETPKTLFETPVSLPGGKLRRRYPLRENPFFHLLLFLATFVTTTLSGGLFTEGGGALGQGSFWDGLPFSVPLLLILGVHELGHYAMCRRYQLAATLPYFLPSPLLNLIGTFGAFIRIKEPIRDKKVLLDVGAAGPLAGFFMAIPFLLYGVARPRPVEQPLVPGTTFLFDYPLIVRLAQDWTGIGRYVSANVHEHPTFMAAWFGMLVTALNLLPLGQLDGGHVLRAALGRRQPLASYLVLALAVVTAIWGPVWAIFSIFVAAVMGVAHPPLWNEQEPLPAGRVMIALLCLLVFLLCFSLVPIRPL